MSCFLSFDLGGELLTFGFLTLLADLLSLAADRLIPVYKRVLINDCLIINFKS